MQLKTGDTYYFYARYYELSAFTEQDVCIRDHGSNRLYVISMDAFKRDYQFIKKSDAAEIVKKTATKKIDPFKKVPWYKRILPRRFR